MSTPQGADGFAGRGDEIYEALLDAHAGLDDAASLALNTRLVVLLAEALRDPDAVKALIAQARLTLRSP